MTFFINKNRRGRWSVYGDIYEGSKRIRRCIKKAEYPIFGFNMSWTIEEAKGWSKKLNKEHHFQKTQLLLSKRRAEQTELQNEILLPSYLVAEFEQQLFEITIGSRRPKVNAHWNTTKKTIINLNISPGNLKPSRTSLFLHFEKRQYSVDYSSKLIRVLNMWSSFVCEKRQIHFYPIHFTLYEKSRLALSQSMKISVRRESLPLTDSQLNSAKVKFASLGKEFQWNWLFCALWFGLRPSELDYLSNQPRLNIETSPAGHQLLVVPQNKLRLSRKELQIKRIPIVLYEQKEAIEFVITKKVGRPHPKLVGRLLGNGHNCYSPRKGFTDLMLSKGFLIEDCALMLGHSKIDTLFSAYKNRKIIRVPEVLQ